MIIAVFSLERGQRQGSKTEVPFHSNSMDSHEHNARVRRSGRKERGRTG